MLLHGRDAHATSAPQTTLARLVKLDLRSPLVSARSISCIAVALITSCLSVASLAGTGSGPKLDGSLESRANLAFSNGDYGKALPLLRAVADSLPDGSSKLAGVQARIKVCEKALAAANKEQIPTAPGERKVHATPAAGQVLEMPIKELGNFDYDSDKGGIPEDVKKLSGCKIRLSGFMIPSDQADKITHFSLVPSLFSCCFGRPPQVQHTILVTCDKGQSVSYTPDNVFVEGTLTVNEKRDDGYVVSIFQVAADRVVRQPK